MRRNDREITNPETIRKIIDNCAVMRLALYDGAHPYIVPVNFGYEYTDGNYSFFFHSAKEGRKIDIIRKNPQAAFEMDCAHSLITAEKAIEYSYAYQSIIGEGIIEPVTDPAEKIRLLKLFMLKQCGKEFTFTPAEADYPAIFRINATSLSAKAHIQGGQHE